MAIAFNCDDNCRVILVKWGKVMIKVTRNVGDVEVKVECDTIEEYIAYDEYTNATKALDIANSGVPIAGYADDDADFIKIRSIVNEYTKVLEHYWNISEPTKIDDKVVIKSKEAISGLLRNAVSDIKNGG